MKIKNSRLPFIFIVSFSLLIMGAILATQYQSASIVNQLKNGNSQSVRTFQIENVVNDIINEIFVIDDLSANYISTGKKEYYTNLQDTLQKLEDDKLLIEKFSIGATDSNKLLIEKFSSLISQKIEPVKKLKSEAGPEERRISGAEIAVENQKVIADSIYSTAIAIQLKFEKDLEKTIIKNELLSGKVLFLARVLSIISIAAIAILATIIIIRLTTHLYLIKELHKANENLQNAKQQTEQAAAVKEQFLSNMSHEIRTPVNSVIGFTNLLQKTNLQGDQKQFTGLIKSAGENLLNIVNDILDISKIEAGMLHFDKNPFNLNELCYSVEMMFYHPITEKKLTYECIIENNVPEIIVGDKERLTQILNNLINNAIKFTAEGSIRLHISLIEKNENVVKLCLSVKDTGIGIAADKVETIFERFEQGETSTTRQYGGTGLGLSIVKKLATLQGGSIIAKSEAGRGSEFIVEMPFGLAKEDALNKHRFESPNNICPVNENSAFTNLKILAAEDNKMNRMLLTYIFQQWQLAYDFAENGQIALEMLQKNKYNLVLMDIQMPVMDGYTAASKIRQDLNLNMPIIAMTANVLPGEKEKCQQFGMNDYISKPLNENILYDLLLKYTRGEKNQPEGEIPMNTFIDLSYLDRIYGGNKKFISELITQFLQQFPVEIEELNKAVKERNYNSVITQSHNLKTTVTYVKINTPLLEHLEKIETTQNIPTGWEIIQHRMNWLSENKELAITEAKHCLKEISS